MEGTYTVVLDELDDIFGERADLVLPTLVVKDGEEGEKQVRSKGERHPPLPDHAGENHVDVLDLDYLTKVLFNQQQVLLPPRPFQHPHHNLRPLMLSLQLIDLVLLGSFGQRTDAHMPGERFADACCIFLAEVGSQNVNVTFSVLEVKFVLQEGRQYYESVVVLLYCFLDSD